MKTPCPKRADQKTAPRAEFAPGKFRCILCGKITPNPCLPAPSEEPIKEPHAPETP